MGRGTFSRDAYLSATTRHVPKGESATLKAEQTAFRSGKLNPLVDPAGYGVIRLSLPRLEKQENGLWLLTVGMPVPIETRLDTTGSMGDNVEIALKELPKIYELSSSVLPGCDIQIATGIFGDVVDRFVLCRPQFEMEAGKIVEQLTLMVPEGRGGDTPEDPQYGLFGAAYLIDRHINKLGLMGYDFTISDAPGRNLIDESQLERIFGPEVIKKADENGYKIDVHNMPSTADVVQDLLKKAHAFFLQVGNSDETTDFWAKVFGSDRIVILPHTELLPQVQATIIGLTEGTLKLNQVEEFLQKNNVGKDYAKRIVRSVANIPIGAQATLPNFSKRPQKGDLFREKTDLWPIDQSEVITEENPTETTEPGPSWL